MSMPAQTIAAAAAAAFDERTAQDAQLARQLRDTLVRITRESVARLFGDRLDVSTLTIDALDMEAGLVIFTDDDVRLAVTGSGDVFLTANVDGAWASDQQPLTDLADLGSRLHLRPSA